MASRRKSQEEAQVGVEEKVFYMWSLSFSLLVHKVGATTGLAALLFGVQLC